MLGAVAVGVAGLSLAAETRVQTPAAQTGSKPGGFRASTVKVDITPQSPQWLMGYGARQSDGVLDNIYHRVVAFDSGDAQFYLISSDLCLFSPTLYDSVTRDLQKETGIDPKHVLWSVTHSHAAPEVGPPDMYKVLLGRSDHEYDRDYTSLATRTLIDAVRTAREKLEPARIAFGSGRGDGEHQPPRHGRRRTRVDRVESRWSRRPAVQSDPPEPAGRQPHCA